MLIGLSCLTRRGRDIQASGFPQVLLRINCLTTGDQATLSSHTILAAVLTLSAMLPFAYVFTVCLPPEELGLCSVHSCTPQFKIGPGSSGVFVEWMKDGNDR